MTEYIEGLHHVTAIASDPQANADFYARTLGQRLVKKTVNFDDPGTYHLYYGDRLGTPGTIMTFFPYVGAARCHAGPGMASAVGYAVAPGALAGWADRLAAAGLGYHGPLQRFGQSVLVFQDVDGLTLELVEQESPALDHAKTAQDLQGFHSVTLCLTNLEPTARLLTEIMGYERVGEEHGTAGDVRLRLRSPAQGMGSAVDLYSPAGQGTGAGFGCPGAGTVHHVAFRTKDDAQQQRWRRRLIDAGHHVTPVVDRQYFNAIYFREPGGVLFEIATEPPGFATDEVPAELGSHLMLPPQHEPKRESLERRLPPIRVDK